MKKKIIGFLGAVALVWAIGLFSDPALAALSFGGLVGWYSPNFGEINDNLDELNDYYGTDFGFEARMMHGLALGYDVNPHFRLRLEYNRFESKTSDDYWAYNQFLDYDAVYRDIDLKLTVTPVVLSGIYKFSPFYIGAGVGSFSTRIKVTWAHEYYRDGILWDTWSGTDSESDSPIGILFLGGFEYSGEGFFGGLEARYVVAEADLEEGVLWAKAHLSGFQICVTAAYKFE